MHFKFSLRAAFVATAVVALFCYWLMLPTIKAQRFIGAVKSSDFRAADNHLRDPKDRFLDDYSKKYWTFQLQAALAPLSAREFLRGERRITFRLAYGGPRPVIIVEGTLVSTARGLSSPEVTTGITRGFSI
jgi:hypothetical protein